MAQTLSAASRGESADEDRQPAPQQLLRRGAQLVAPVDHPAQGALVPGSGVVAAGQQREPVLQALCQLPDGEGPQSGRGQFEGERQSVQVGAEPGHFGLLRGAGGELRPDGGGSVPQQRGRVLRRQWRYGEDVLAGHAQRVAARRQDAQRRRARQKRLGQFGTGTDHVLAVVQDQQSPLPRKVAGQLVDEGPGAEVRHPHGAGSGGRHRRQVVHRGQVHQPHPVRKRLPERAGRLQRQPGLAHAAHSGERQQPPHAQQPPDLGHLVPTAHETRERRRQISRLRGDAGHCPHLFPSRMCP